MAAHLPEIKHIYQHPIVDSTRWQHFHPRPDDIVISTSPKAGTTWMQTIVLNLIFQDDQPRDINAFSPWLDNRVAPIEAVIAKLDAQPHRRCIKSHLPLDGLLYFPQVKYIMVGRDARDVFMSLWNHDSSMTPELRSAFNNTPGRVGDPFPPLPDDIREYWQRWMTRGWFDWESEGYPRWGNLRQTQTWWDFRDLPNILLVHYNDLKQNLEGETARIAAYLDIPLTPDTLHSVTRAASFSTMKQNADLLEPDAGSRFKGGAQTFINKGTNGRWRDLLTEDDLKLYSAAVTRVLTPDCAQWLEHGRLAAE